MSVVKCRYCHVRIPPRQLPLHLKSCVNYRRLLKAGKIDAQTIGLNKTIAGSIEAHSSVSSSVSKEPLKDTKAVKDKKSFDNKVQTGKKHQG